MGWENTNFHSVELNDSKTSIDFWYKFQEKLSKLVDDFMLDAGKTAVRIRPTPQEQGI